MADQQQLDILREGTEAWSLWRIQQPVTIIDLSDADLSYAHLERVNLKEANLRGANLSYAYLKEAHFQRAHLNRAHLNGVSLSNADLSYTHLEGADLSYAFLNDATLSYTHLEEANLSHVYLRHSFLNNAILSGADLSSGDLSYAHLNDANLKGAKLNKANLRYTLLNATDLKGASLREADLRDANLTGADLSEADLHGAHLNGANLKGTCLQGTNLKEAILSDAQLNNTILTEANLTDATVGWTLFAMLDLRAVKGLEHLHHEGPSTIGIDTMQQSGGTLPNTFLRGAGLSEWSLSYVRSLSQTPGQYRPCFISYSKIDFQFAQRLQNDLQQRGRRCWLAPEPVEGEKFSRPIEETIRLYDTLLLILSQSALESSWFEDAARVAQEKEEQLKKELTARTILFPIAIDSSTVQKQAQWIITLRNQKTIEDFTHWNDQTRYEKSLERLLHNLQAKI